MTEQEAKVELFIYARNSFEDIAIKAQELGLYDDFMMIASVGLVTGNRDSKSIVESVSSIDVDSAEEMNALMSYLASSYAEMEDDDDDPSDVDFWLNLN